MAQAVFNEHPLDAYLQQTGEPSQPMPGMLPELLAQGEELFDGDEAISLNLEDILVHLPPPLLQLLHTILATFSPTAAEEREFSERFKYRIISSSLLTASISPPQSAGPSRSFNAGRETSGISPLTTERPSRRHTSPSPASVSPPVVLLCLCCFLFFLYRSLLLAVLFATAVYYSYTCVHNSGPPVDRMQPQTLNTLNELIAAGDLWESTIHEAYAHIENEESSTYPSNSATLSAPSTALRVAVLSALQTTQTQCDNVRQVLSALTAPTALAQLSEMYAPPSPARPALKLSADSPRPRTLPARSRTRSTPQSHDKRSTWGGPDGYSYSALASAGSPSRRVLRRHEKRRSDLSALLEGSGSRPMSISAPVTPDLDEVQEEDEGVQSIMLASASSDDEMPFGSAALHLQRGRRANGMNALGFPSLGSPPRSSPPNVLRHSLLGHSPRSASVTSPGSSRFTSMQTTKHPLSLSALNHSLNGALSAKRYAAAHLLALRFEEEEDDQYWGDVREVMALLASALADATTRLSASLEDAEQHHLQEQNPTPTSSRRSSAQLLGPIARKPQTQAQTQTFAPMPSEFARFAVHVDAINSALTDARESLEVCVTALRDESALPSAAADRDAAMHAVAGNPAVQAYERLRRELGLALRECERGRERLLGLVAPASVSSDSEDEDEDVPALAHDASDESEKGHPPPTSPETTSPLLGGDAVLVHAPPPAAGGLSEGLEALLAERLPPQGIEQVFEAEPDELAGFVRERSKVPREERIRQAKARRAAGLGLSLEEVGPGAPLALGPPGERWGPSGEVVNELKDVIYKVGERRRRRAEEAERAGALERAAEAL